MDEAKIIVMKKEFAEPAGPGLPETLRRALVLLLVAFLLTRIQVLRGLL